MSTQKKEDPVLARLREEAWVGDAVLALFMRLRILNEDKVMDGEKFVRATSNDFLRDFGNPTEVEARIGRIYAEEGLQPAFDWMERELLPRFFQREHNHAQRMANKKKRGKKKPV